MLTRRGFFGLDAVPEPDFGRIADPVRSISGDVVDQIMPSSIVVFGSAVVDLVLNPERLPKPGLTVLAPGYQLLPGGKGSNQAYAASRVGCNFSRGTDELCIWDSPGKDVRSDPRCFQTTFLASSMMCNTTRLAYPSSTMTSVGPCAVVVSCRATKEEKSL